MAVVYALQRLCFGHLVAGDWSAVRSCADEALALGASVGPRGADRPPLAWLTLAGRAPGPGRVRRPVARARGGGRSPPAGHPHRSGARPDPLGQGEPRRRRRRHASPRSTTCAGCGVPAIARMAAVARIDAAVRADDPDLAAAGSTSSPPSPSATGRPWALAAVAYGRAMTAGAGPGRGAVRAGAGSTTRVRAAASTRRAPSWRTASGCGGRNDASTPGSTCGRAWRPSRTCGPSRWSTGPPRSCAPPARPPASATPPPRSSSRRWSSRSPSSSRPGSRTRTSPPSAGSRRGRWPSTCATCSPRRGSPRAGSSPGSTSGTAPTASTVGLDRLLKRRGHHPGHLTGASDGVRDHARQQCLTPCESETAMSIDTHTTPPPDAATAPRGPLGRIIAGSLAAGLVTALVLSLVVFAGASEPTITGSMLIAFGARLGPAGTAVGASHQPAAALDDRAGLAMGVTGLALVALTPGDERHDRARAGCGRRPCWRWRRTSGCGPAAACRAAAAGSSRRSSPCWPSPRSPPPSRTSPCCATSTATPPPGTGTTSTATGSTSTAEAQGGPTVVLDNGLGEVTASWARIVAQVGPTTRVCAYDRAGQGWSDDAAGTPRTASPPPTTCTACSASPASTAPTCWSGTPSAAPTRMTYAAQYPQQVAGMVLLDSSSPEQFTEISGYAGQYAVMRRALALAPTSAGSGWAGSSPPWRPPTCPAPEPTACGP